jgi:hypothetical protein
MEINEREIRILLNLFDEIMELGSINLTPEEYNLFDKLERS